MNIRKIVREHLEQIFEAHQDRGPFKGMEILNQYPFSKLPEDRMSVDWKNRGVKGWGEVRVPSVEDVDSMTSVFGKDDVVDYIKRFVKKFNEEPIFSIHPNEVWFNKIKIVNPKFNDWQKEYGAAKQSWINQYGSGD